MAQFRINTRWKILTIGTILYVDWYIAIAIESKRNGKVPRFRWILHLKFSGFFFVQIIEKNAFMEKFYKLPFLNYPLDRVDLGPNAKDPRVDIFPKFAFRPIRIHGDCRGENRGNGLGQRRNVESESHLG